MAQISSPGLPAASSPAWELGEGSGIAPIACLPFSPWGHGEENHPGAGCLGLLLGAAVQDSPFVEHLAGVKAVLESWGLSAPLCQLCQVSSTTPAPGAGGTWFW